MAKRTYCYRIDAKKLNTYRAEYVGAWPEHSGEVHGVGGMEGIAGKSAFLEEKDARQVLIQLIHRQLNSHVYQTKRLLDALIDLEQFAIRE